MALEIWYPTDIRNALLAAEQASNAPLAAANGQDNPFAQGYMAGYRAALTTIALAFGLIPPGCPNEQRDGHLPFLSAGGR